MTKIAYFISLHEKPEQFKRLLRAIYHPDNVYLIHVDAKSSKELHDAFQTIIEPYSNVYSLPPMNVVYACWPMVEMTLKGISRLLALDSEWEYVINLSGVDFPLKTQEEIRNFLEPYKHANFFEYTAVSDLPADHFKRPWYTHIAFEWKNSWSYVKSNRPKPDFEIYLGSNWFIMHRSFARYVTQDKSVKRYKVFFHSIQCPDENFFQTALMNHPVFKTTVIKNHYRHIIWKGGPKPITLTIAEWPELSTSQAFFARKFDLDVDAEIIYRLEEKLGINPEARTESENTC